MNVIKFMKNRKKDNRQSLIIDNIDLDKFNKELNSHQFQRSNSFSQSSDYSSEKDNYQDEYRHEESNVKIIKKKYEHIENSPIMYKKIHNIKSNKEHSCNLCDNKNNVKDTFMILTCGHIFHITCLVDDHYSEANKYGVIDEAYFNSRCCLVCDAQMEMEDILYIHNKFYKSTKENLVKQQNHIDVLDKQMTKLKDELRTCYEYKQRLEHQREKSKQITVTINTLM
jgi:hypothetical protein